LATQRIERRLAAILAADIAGYGRLMGADEEGTLARLKAHRRDLIDAKIGEHKGRIVKTTGDGILIEFPSVLEAASCGLAVQRGMVECNAESRDPQLVALASRDGVPTIYPWCKFAYAGVLISYGPSLTAVDRQLGTYAGKILKGAKPADLPVQQPTTFELVVDLRTAQALGLTIRQSILARVGEVIE
jgi:hypothetical protein